MSNNNCLNTDLYCITAERYSNGRDNLQVVKELLRAGIKVIQYREKEKTMLDKYQECQQIRELTSNYGATFIVNDHLDLALAVKADGIHIGQEDLPIEIVRDLIGEDMIIGLSTHSPDQADDAIDKGADYIGVGPIFPTNTKKNVSSPVGLEYLKYVVDNIDIPFVAIGGIKEDNIGSVREVGANCICLITEIVGVEDIGKKIANIRQQLR